MSPLTQPPASLAYIQNNFSATPASNTLGTGITLGGTPHVKTAWVSLIDPLLADCYWLDLFVNATSATVTNSRTLVDIGIGPSGGGSEQVILPNLLCGATGAPSAVGVSRAIGIPIFLPRGARLSARAQSVRTSFTMSVGVSVRGGPSFPPWWVASAADDYGVTTASSSGTAHTPGNTGAESAWASIGGTTSRPYQAVLALSQIDTQTVVTTNGYHMEFGAGSTTWGEFYDLTNTSEQLMGFFPNPLMYQPVPIGTQMQARGECQGTAQSRDVALYGLY